MFATPAQKRLALALTSLKQLQDAGKLVVRSSDLTRAQREILLANGFLRLIAKGWYMPSKPGEGSGDSTPWRAAMTDFVQGYCDSRFGNTWCVSAEYSLLRHAGNTRHPKQVVVHAPNGKNTVLRLPEGCSLLDYKARDFAPAEQREIVDGLRVMKLPYALSRVSEVFFRTFATDAQIALQRLPDASELNRVLLGGGHSVVAGRLAGALRALGRGGIADDIVSTMRAVGYAVSETNPFDQTVTAVGGGRADSAYVLRMRLMWQQMRPAVLAAFPPEPGIPKDVEGYMQAVENNYRTDAYHSLSIEGYRVTDALIERVATGDWSPEEHSTDANARNAMAAHGYWHAHNAVKESIRKILAGASPGEVARSDHGVWFRALFSPSVDAKILQAADLAGYRGHQVYIRNAAHVPPAREAVREMMPEFFSLLANEPSAVARAVLGHFLFVFIHPYMDGNGRIGRFLMNAMLASGGFPWTVIRLENRDNYMAALDAASGQGDIRPFAAFVAAAVPNRNGG